MDKPNFLKYFQHNDKDKSPNIPNEIFNDLISCPLFKKFHQRAFAYSYYYLTLYLYRNCKYGSIVPLSKLGQLQLFEVFGVSRERHTFITKKDGVLDELGYTQSQSDFPISYTLDEDGNLDFQYYFEEVELTSRKIEKLPPRFTIKFPVKAFYREKGDEFFTGTFFEPTNTHIIDFNVFNKCMEYEDGIEMFYLYAYLKCYEPMLSNPNKKIYRGYISKPLGVSEDAFRKYLSLLVDAGLVKIICSIPFQYKLRTKPIPKSSNLTIPKM